MKKYLLLILPFSLIILALTWWAGEQFFPNKVDRVTYFQILYFFLVTLIFHAGLLRSSKGRPQEFIRYYMGSTTGKLLLHVVVILGYSFINRQDAFRFIIIFLVYYIFFTFFEAVVVFRQFSAQKGNSSAN